MRPAVRACAVVIAAGLAVAGCSASRPRVIVRNDTGRTQHVFYCDNDACTRGLGGNDLVLQPGGEAHDYWNSADPTGPIGVASYPGNRLLGCLSNPTDGQDDPPTVTVLTSQVKPCSPAWGANAQIQLTHP